VCSSHSSDPVATPAPLPTIEAPQFGNDELLQVKSKKGKGLRIGTKQLQIPLGGSEGSSSGLAIPQ
jgi:hypothetical protein